MDLLVGYDGSPAANTAIRVGTMLFPGARALITYVQTPPFASRDLRRRLRLSANDVAELAESVEREGKYEAQLLVDTGVALASAGGWLPEPVLKQAWGGEGIGLAQLAQEHAPDALVVGSRGLSGSDAMLGSVSELLVHHSTRPVLVSKQTLLVSEYKALAAGPVIVGFDQSEGANAAVAATRRLFPTRELLAVSVSSDDDSPASVDAPEGVSVINAAPHRGRGSGATADTLIATADEHDAALIVIGSRGRSALQRVLLGSVARTVLQRAYRPVMVVPNVK
ncbi:MAG: universal stress protein [Mycobacterium sp.]